MGVLGKLHHATNTWHTGKSHARGCAAKLGCVYASSHASKGSLAISDTMKKWNSSVKAYKHLGFGKQEVLKVRNPRFIINRKLWTIIDSILLAKSYSNHLKKNCE